MRKEHRRVFGRSSALPFALLSLLFGCVLAADVRAQGAPAAEPAPAPTDAAESDAGVALEPSLPAATTDDDTKDPSKSDAAPSVPQDEQARDGATTTNGADAVAPSTDAAGTATVSTDAASTDAANASAPAKEDAPSLVDASLDSFRTPVDRLTEHYLGSTSRPVRFDWRNSLFILGVHGGELIERNNFGSFRLGAVVRRAFLSIMFEAAASYVFVIGTESSELLALTPYRQASRPPRAELDVNVSYPLFEGVVTPLFDFIPTSEMVFSVTGGGRYLLYPQTIIGERDWDRTSTWTDTQTWQDIGAGLATAQLLDDDRRLLERRGLPGMQIDPATVHTLAGFTFDAYYQPGLFFSARALLAIPALYLVSGTRLGFWWETTLVAGWAF